MNLAFTRLRWEGERRARPESNHEVGGSSEALWEMLKHRAPGIEDKVMREYGYEIGVEVARLVVGSLLADISAGVAAIVDRSIAAASKSYAAA